MKGKIVRRYADQGVALDTEGVLGDMDGMLAGTPRELEDSASILSPSELNSVENKPRV